MDGDNDDSSTSSNNDDIKKILDTIKSEISTQNASESNATSDNDEVFNIDILKQVFSTDQNNIEAEDTELFTDIIAFLDDNNKTNDKQDCIDQSSISTKSFDNEIIQQNDNQSDESISERLHYNSYDDDNDDDDSDEHEHPVVIQQPVTEKPKLKNIQQTTIIDDSNNNSIQQKQSKSTKKQSIQCKRLIQSTRIDDCDENLTSNPISLGSTSSLLLRNKYEYAPEYQPYEHNSIQKELKQQKQRLIQQQQQQQQQEQSKTIPIYTTKSVNSDIIKTVTNTLCDLKVISESLHLSSDIEHQLNKLCHHEHAMNTNLFNFNQCQCIFKEYPNITDNNDNNNNNSSNDNIKQPTIKSSSSLSSQQSDDRNNKKQYLEDLTKSLVDSETYFQKCLTELYNCAAKVVAHKNDFNTAATTPTSTCVQEITKLPTSNDAKKDDCIKFDEKNTLSLTDNTNIKQFDNIINIVGNNSTLNDTLSEEKVKEIEKSMKELDKNRVLCTDLKLNREYKDDLMSLIDKLKFLASYKKKVALRPKLVTQMEFDSSSFITSNQQQTQPQHQHQHEYRHEIKDSVQKVVEWKRITNNYINTDISAEIKIKKPRGDGNTSINNSITYDEKSSTNEKKKERVTKHKIKTKKDDLINKRDDNKNYQPLSSRSSKLVDKFNKEQNDLSPTQNSDYQQKIKSFKINHRKTKPLLDDDETRLLSQVTPSAIAPFSAEYSKQRRIKQKTVNDKKLKNDNQDDASIQNEDHNDNENKHITLSDVQYLQNLITDPNARFKTTMTIMPVTVKKSPIRTYIRGGSVSNRTLYNENEITKYNDNRTVIDNKYKEKPEKPLEKVTNEKKNLFINNTYTNLIDTNNKNAQDICVKENELSSSNQSSPKLNNSKLETQKRNALIKEQLKMENKPQNNNNIGNGIVSTRRFESLAMPKKYYIQAQRQEYKHRLGPQFENRMSTIINKNIKSPSTNLVNNVLNKLDEIIDGDNIPYNKKDKSIIDIPSPIEEENLYSSSTVSKFSGTNANNNATISTTIVTGILKNLLTSVIQHEPLNCKKFNGVNSLENFRNLLYENCSSSTLFRKLDEILSYDSISHWTMNSDTTMSSLLSSIDDLSNVIIRHKYLLFGVRFETYFTIAIYNTKVYYLSTIIYSTIYEDCVTQHPLELMGFINEVTSSVRTLPVPSLTPDKDYVDFLDRPIIFHRYNVLYFRSVVLFSSMVFLPLVFDVFTLWDTIDLVENVKPLMSLSNHASSDNNDECVVLKSDKQITVQQRNTGSIVYNNEITDIITIAYKDMPLLVLYSFLFVCVFSCLVVHPVCL
ncbi:SUN domain-containing protein 2-like [Chrysoperla carnea]|uniref:SUN domain-containing protein 2-like n=1 Tax=Chrysoperla carnea TaxID=189513 RepID=UPI001D075B19|nr:SUN domain-containing protein 2-like [Chrysoperla carnea]